MEAPIYSTEGVQTGTVMLPESLFGAAWNADLVHRVVVAMQANARTPVAHAKGRGEVRGGGKKPWRQKGTGRARHGSIRSPLWRGGGVTHGPSNERSYEQKINKKMRHKALAVALSKKMRDGEILFVEDFVFTKPATKDAATILAKLATVKGFEKLAYKKGNRALIARGGVSDSVKKSFRNIGSVQVTDVAALNPATLLSYRYLVIAEPQESVRAIESRLARRTAK